MTGGLRITVLGIMGRIPFAGVAWQVLHYLEGFKRLGHEVYYVEDTEKWPYNPETGTSDSTYTVNYIARMMSWCGMDGRWAFRSASENGRLYGLSDGEFHRVLRETDVLVNLHGATRLRDRYLEVPVRVYLETDPGAPQFQIAGREPGILERMSAHTHHFTFAENLGAPECALPPGPFRYHPTRQPVVLAWWNGEGPRLAARAHADASAGRFTTVASWKQTGNDVEWNGEVYTWSKHEKLAAFFDLPSQTSQPLGMALACGEPDVVQTLRAHGWRIIDALTLTSDILPYRDYVCGSRGEFTVAKDQYARTRSGWFSDRSASYLAAGKPVVTEDTGFGRIFPDSEGLFAFQTKEDVVTALETINSDYQRHCRAAFAVAEEYFKAEKVLAELIAALNS